MEIVTPPKGCSARHNSGSAVPRAVERSLRGINLYGSIRAVLPVIAANIGFLRLICRALKGFAIGGRGGSDHAPEKAYKMIGTFIADFEGYFGNG